jgi:hypothetical protein
MLFFGFGSQIQVLSLSGREAGLEQFVVDLEGALRHHLKQALPIIVDVLEILEPQEVHI